MTTMLFERVGDVVVLVHSSQDPSDAEWDKYVRFVSTSVELDPEAVSGLLVTSFGGSPNAMQRKAVLAAAGPTTAVTCICTDSSVVRGVITAFRWLSSVPVHALPLNNIDAALQLLAVPAGGHAQVKATVLRLQAQLNK